SRLPLAAAPIALGYAWAPALRGVVETAAGPVGVLGVHPPRPGTGARCHERDTALAAIPAVVADMPERRIVLGDFNATPWNAAFRALLANTGLRHANGTGFHPTWHTKLPWPLRIPIDHVMVDGLGVVATEVGASFGSDHAPLLARLSF
ncbi:MAG: endonuclease/exonuclease/phosphatase family protein, partial [Planctomycetes bacterium]|nr:endonuclease/exonuclease/phosphatase family protein [Planctomycetota bacterium]